MFRQQRPICGSYYLPAAFLESILITGRYIYTYYLDASGIKIIAICDDAGLC